MMECTKFHSCDCEYCEYVELQNSMTILPTKSISTNSVHKVQESDKSIIVDSIVTTTPSVGLVSFEATPIFRQWNRLLVLLRILGSCPLTHKSGNDHRRSEVIFRWISWASLYTLVVDVFRIAACIWYYQDWASLITGRKFENTLVDWILKSMNYSLPLNQIWDILVVWGTGKRGAKLCNAWIDFHFLFQKTFVLENSKADSQVRKWNWIKGVVMTAVIIGVSAGVFHELFRGNSSQEYDLPHLLRFPPALLFLSTMILDEVRVLLMYFITADSFRKIRFAIAEELKNMENATIITSRVVYSWTKIILAIRNMVKLTGNLQAPFLIPAFVQTTLMFTGILFFGIRAHSAGRESKDLVIFAIIGGSFTIRLILKIIMAENIFLEEQAVVDLLLKIDAGEFDVNSKLELSRIIQTLQRKPSKISLSGYVTVEKKLITKVMGQIVTYLVILIQFDLGYYGNKRVHNNCGNDTVLH